MNYKAREVLLYFAHKYKGDFFAVIKALKEHEEINHQNLEKIKNAVNDYEVLTILDETYPAVLKTMNQPPLCLFYKGDIRLLDDLNKSIAVVGTRNSSEYGKTKTLEIAGDLAKQGYTIISGMAKGIDAYAHQAALQVGGKTIAVLGSGINEVYPYTNIDLYKKIVSQGLVISEYPGNTKPEPDFFKFRNRLVAGLATNVLVTEAKYRSGTVITVGYALEKGADIFCLPTKAGEESGTNKLIQDGAYLIESAADILKYWRS